MAAWRVRCEGNDEGPCPTLTDGVAKFGQDEAAARAEFPLHAGHGRHTLHYCNDMAADPKARWNDADDPRAHFEEAT